MERQHLSRDLTPDWKAYWWVEPDLYDRNMPTNILHSFHFHERAKHRMMHNHTTNPLTGFKLSLGFLPSFRGGADHSKSFRVERDSIDDQGDEDHSPDPRRWPEPTRAPG